MTSRTINSDSRTRRRFRLPAAIAGLALASLVAATPSSAHSKRAPDHKVSGVRAALKHGTLKVTGSDGGQQVALRLSAGTPSAIQVDADNNGSADFSFASDDVDAITVKIGDGN